jgi:NADH-quinone oxidoreductase subunit E
MLKEKYAQEIEILLARYPEGRERSAVLPLLHMAQDEHGYTSKEAIDEVADILGLDPTEVLGIAGFYTLYYEEPVGKYVLEVCNDLPCALRGADQFIEMACRKLGVGLDETTPDGLFTVKNVMCLAACDKAPMLQCNLKYVENLTEGKFDELIASLRAEAASGKMDDSVVKKILLETLR